MSFTVIDSTTRPLLNVKPAATTLNVIKRTCVYMADTQCSQEQESTNLEVRGRADAVVAVGCVARSVD